MGNSLLSLFLLLCSVTVAASVADAAEVINLKVGQSGDKGFATYDLAGKIGEREAEVTVYLVINGEKFSAERLTLSGDLGKKVKTGVGRRIVWDILADIPTGFDGEVTWNVDTPATSPSAPAVKTAVPAPVVKQEVAPPSAPVDLDKSHPFEFSEKTARDNKTGLLWMREVSKGGRTADMMTARSYASSLGAERFAGCSNWRLSSAGEMQNIISYATAAGYSGKKTRGYPADYFNAIGFKQVTNEYFWISGTPIGSWLMLSLDLEDGNTLLRDKSEQWHYWPVCKP